jgi:uncharacterized YccA/Bax inhibitor family protein
MFRTSNPVLARDIFSRPTTVASDVMTVQGTVTKTIFLILLTMGTAGFAWSQFFAKQDVTPLLAIGAVTSIVAFIVIWFRGAAGFITAPLYAAGKGLLLGGISAMVQAAYPKYPGLVIQSVALTFGTLFMLLLAYKVRLIRATEGFKAGIIAATGGICLVYLVDFVLRFFVGTQVPFIHESGAIGIGFSVFVVAIAALNLVLDFDYIERGAQVGLPRNMEWYGAFGLLVTLIWLYWEILRLLIKIQSGSSRRSSGGVSA